MKIKADLKNYVDERLEGLVCSHIEAWCGHYAGMSVNEALYEIDVNYDWRAEFEEIEDELKRELSENEETYIFNQYLKLFKKNYKESMIEGYKLHTGYYLKH